MELILAFLGVLGLGGLATVWLQQRHNRRESTRERRHTAYASLDEALQECSRALSAVHHAMEKAWRHGGPRVWPWHVLRNDLQAAHAGLVKRHAEARLVLSDTVSRGADSVAGKVWVAVVLAEPIYTAFYEAEEPDVRSDWSEPAYQLEGDEDPGQVLLATVPIVEVPMASVVTQVEAGILDVRRAMKSELGTCP